MRHFIILLFFIGICFFANAQKKVHYSGGVEGGISKGSNPVSGFLFTTQGIAFKQYTFSAGSGTDFYGFRSVPLFVDVKRKFSNKALQPYIQAATGINFTSPNSTDAKSLKEYAGGGHFENGFFLK